MMPKKPAKPPQRPARLPPKRVPNNAQRQAWGPRQPTQIESQYAKAIKAMIAEARAATLSALKSTISNIAANNGSADRKDSVRFDAPSLKPKLKSIFSPTRAARAADGASKATASHVDKQLGSIFKIKIRDTVPAKTFDDFRKENVNLITSISKNLFGDVTDVLNEATDKAWRVEDIQEKILERFSVSESRAELIARDQVLKLNANVTEYRHKQAGIEEYIWTTVGPGESRVRPMHAALDGTKQRYDDPPVTNEDGDTNNPGEDYQCRCIAYPVVPEFDDIDSEESE